MGLSVWAHIDRLGLSAEALRLKLRCISDDPSTQLDLQALRDVDYELKAAKAALRGIKEWLARRTPKGAG